MARHTPLARQLVQMARDVTVGLLSAVWPGMSDEDVADWLADHRHPGRVITATLTALLALSFAFAQFGLIGLIVFLAVVLIVVN